MSVLLFTGHRLDWLGRATPRFPPELVPVVLERLSSTLDDLQATEPIRAGVCSLAAGSDLLFAQACMSKGIPLHVFLPFRLPDFIAESVSYLKSDADRTPWESLLHAALAYAAQVCFTSEAYYNPADDQFEQCNHAMLDHARLVAAADHALVQALVFVQEDQASLPGGSTQFLDLLHQEHIPVLNLSPTLTA
ncbi:hypothetical protein F0P96_00400 [Hymenobacter busanensis]|uniref:Uncharacterized protein n=1 Tax=Hymenobacter busanensis TaxID=2607656 RepID=A0A7L5A054_9BACT|nr:hypothetical protein [Hymenobacter busanensis]KAA9339128.1 hypothetical protein F0P96_00400 [Hymenobacter busanensis]QHJ07110.1 hypothetical protein GUY19_07350 [Hymenobacter busanensis]